MRHTVADVLARARTYWIWISGSLGFSLAAMATTLELDPVGPDGVADIDADSCAAEMGSIVRPRGAGRVGRELGIGIARGKSSFFERGGTHFMVVT